MNQIESNFDINRQESHERLGSVKSGSETLARSFVNELTSMGSGLKKMFQHGLLDKLQQSAIALSDSVHSKSNYNKFLQVSDDLVAHLVESHPDLVEELLPDLKKMRKDNKKMSVSDYFSVMSQFAFSYSKTDSSSLSKTGIHTNFLSSILSAKDRCVVLKKPVESFFSNQHSSSIKEDDSLFSLVASFSNEELMQIIRSMLENGLDSMDDLFTLLQLVGELGLLASATLLSSVSDAIQSFVETQATMVSDPLELLRLARLVREFSQGDFVEGINMDSLETKLMDLTSGLSGSQQRSVVSEISASSLNIAIAPSLDESPIVTSEQEGEVSLNAEQMAGSQSYKQENIRDNLTYKEHHDDAIHMEHTKVSKIEKSLLGNESEDQFDSSDSLDSELLDSYSSIMKSLDDILEHNKAEFSEQMLGLIQAVYKHSLEGALDSFDD